MVKVSRFLLAVWVLASGVSAVLAGTEEKDAGYPPSNRVAMLVDVKGPIGPATSKYVSDALAATRKYGARIVILRMDTPGGLADSMREIIRDILASPVPVVGYVSPSGARAASAGTYILYASHIAAMAPGTNLGAATPVQIGGPPTPLPDWTPGEAGDAGGGQEGGAETDASGGEGGAKEAPPVDATTAKAMNDAAAYIRSLADLHGRNAEWAERAVREAASLPAREALELNVIDLIATGIPELLVQLNGRSVTIGGLERVLDTVGFSIVRIEPDWKIDLLSTLTNPNIAFILMMIGVYGLVFEFANPGSIVPGVIGAICLMLGLYALNLLPLNYAGLGLLILGMACMIAEAFIPSFGVLGLGGLVAFVLGATFMLESDAPAFQLSWSVILGSAGVSVVLLIFMLRYIWRAHQRPVTTGSSYMIGSKAEVLEWSGTKGHVLLSGERWRATGGHEFKPGQAVAVRELQGLTLVVDSLDQQEDSIGEQNEGSQS